MANFRGKDSFNLAPSLVGNLPRSTFDRSHNHKTTFNTGQLVPALIDEVYPGDTFQMHTSFVLRTSNPLIVPIYDNMFVDFHYFFVPNRLVWENWKYFNGEAKSNSWAPNVTYNMPQLIAPAEGWAKGSLAEKMGLPIGVPGLSAQALPFRGYSLIWNEWYRNQNVQAPVLIGLNDSNITGSNYVPGSWDVSTAQYGGVLAPVNKYHDYFTSALPSPQKGEAVKLSLAALAPVRSLNQAIPNPGGQNGLRFVRSDTGLPMTGAIVPITLSTGTGSVFAAATGTGSNGQGTLSFDNLWADLSQATAATVNSIRTSFQVQRMLEKEARGGSRYTELIRSHFGVLSPDSRQQRPEYLGGSHNVVNITQVLQTSATSATSAQANPAAFSLTSGSAMSFSKSFTEHGFLFGLVSVRYNHTYQQGVERFWNRKNKLDYYLPVFANLGEQAILLREIYAKGAYANADNVFGFQEAWAELRYKPDRVSGAFRSDYATSLDVWHLADNYSNPPVLGDQWMRESLVNVDRTLSVTSTVEDQFLLDIQFNNRATRVLPTYSIPGLIDHF